MNALCDWSAPARTTTLRITVVEVEDSEVAIEAMNRGRHALITGTYSEIITVTTSHGTRRMRATATHVEEAIEVADEVATREEVEVHLHRITVSKIMTGRRISATTRRRKTRALTTGATTEPQRMLKATVNDMNAIIFMQMIRRLIPTSHHNQFKK